MLNISTERAGWLSVAGTAVSVELDPSGAHQIFYNLGALIMNRDDRTDADTEKALDPILLEPPREITLEYALEFIRDDELVEVTPKATRIRKRHLKEHERKRASRGRVA